MFEWLKEFKIILVSGPPRSGTKICARMIAHDTGHTYVDEAEVDYTPASRAPNRLPQFIECVRERGQKVVIQCPGWFEELYTLSGPDTLMIVMHRDIDDIIRSERGIGWATGEKHRKRLEYQYRMWPDAWKPLCENALDIIYGNLAAHSMWIPPEERGHWKRADEWQKRPPLLMLVAIEGTSPAAKQIHEVLITRGVNSKLCAVGCELYGLHDFIMAHRPHYAIFALETLETEPGMQAIAISKSDGCQIVIANPGPDIVGCTSRLQTILSSNPRLDMIIPEHDKVIDALVSLGAGAHPKDIASIFWKDRLTKALAWGK